jgi:hypothetical protein
MLLLLFVSVAILGILFFGGYLALSSMLIGGVVIALIWWISVCVAEVRERRRA